VRDVMWQMHYQCKTGGLLSELVDPFPGEIHQRSQVFAWRDLGLEPAYLA
jgi:hypothetical protein